MRTRHIPAFPLCDGSKTYEMYIPRSRRLQKQPGSFCPNRALCHLGRMVWLAGPLESALPTLNECELPHYFRGGSGSPVFQTAGQQSHSRSSPPQRTPEPHRTAPSRSEHLHRQNGAPSLRQGHGQCSTREPVLLELGLLSGLRYELQFRQYPFP